MRINSILKVAALTLATSWFAQSASAETVLKLGTVGFKGMPIGDAIDQALIPTLEKVSGGTMKIEPHYRKSLCSEQSCGEQANQGLISLWTSSTANFGNFGTSLAVNVVFRMGRRESGFQTKLHAEKVRHRYCSDIRFSRLYWSGSVHY